MPERVMALLAKETGGKSYKAHKYGLDHAERPYIDYGEDSIIWERTAETIPHRNYVSLDLMRKKMAEQNGQLLTYFLDGSRRVFKVDDIAYPQSNGRSVIYPVIAGQIGVACTERRNRQLRVQPENFIQEFVISLPDIADADGKPGFFPAIAQKLNACQTLKNMNIQFSTILPYKTGKEGNKKYEDRGTACIQDRMIEQEKRMVADLVRAGKLNQDNYLIKDGSLEYRPTKEDRADKKTYQRFRNNYDYVLGVSKNFNPEVCIDIKWKS